MNTREPAERLHESTKHGTPPADPGALVAYRRLDPHNTPGPFKEYRGLPRIALPGELVGSTPAAVDVLSGRRGEAGEMTLSLLSTLLFLSGGVTRVMELPGRRIYFRAAMSAGNLHPVELYLVAGDEAVDDLEAGVYHFSPLEMGLTLLRSGDFRGLIAADAPLAIVLTGIPWRTTWKYGERGWRHLYWDAGTLLANMLAVADAHGIAHRTNLGFGDDRVSALVGIDGTEEMPLGVVLLGELTRPGPSPRADPLSVDVAPVAPRPVRLPLLEEAQSGSRLGADDVAAWIERGVDVARAVPLGVQPPEGPGDAIEEVILRRGSTRRMVHETVPRSGLEWPMAAATRAVGIDVLPGATLLDHYVNIHAVEGLGPAAFHYTGAGWDLVGRPESLREQSARLCLGQDLGGDSAYTVFHCAEIDSILEVLGSRGYRAAQLEAGVVSGRLALCAFALGLGATGLTFFDDVVSSFFGVTAQPMLVTSVGVPATRPAPSGSPGNPVILRA